MSETEVKLLTTLERFKIGIKISSMPEASETKGKLSATTEASGTTVDHKSSNNATQDHAQYVNEDVKLFPTMGLGASKAVETTMVGQAKTCNATKSTIRRKGQ